MNNENNTELTVAEENTELTAAETEPTVIAEPAAQSAPEPAYTPVAEIAAEADAKPKKKMSLAGKIILTVVIVLLVLVLAVGGLGVFAYNRATQDNMPQAPEVTGDMTMFAIDAALNVLSKNPINATAEDIDMVLASVKTSVNESLARSNMSGNLELVDLFCQLEGESGVIYGRMYVGELPLKGIKLNLDKTIAFSADFDVAFEAPYITAAITSLKVGELSIPVRLAFSALGSVELPEMLKIEGDMIYYDTSTLDSMVDDAVNDLVMSSLGDNAIAQYLAEQLGNLIDVQITDAKISDGSLVISGTVLD